MNKKAFEIQFNWIFVLVAGTAILLFFAAIVVKQKNIAETSTRATILKSIEAIITSAGVSKDTTTIIDIPNSDINVDCGRVSIGGVSKQYQSLLLFAPSLIKGNKLITQTSAFSIPYRAVNLLYITSPQLRYIIIGNSSLAGEINKSLPSDLKKEFYQSIPAIKNENNYKVRFVVFGDMIGFPKSLEKMPNSDVTAINVIGDAEKGTIEFYQKDDGSWLLKGSSIYLGKHPLIGAVYTDTLDMYECNMQNVFSRLNLVTKIYSDRINELIKIGAVTGREECNQFYNNALAQLEAIDALSLSFEEQNAAAIIEASKFLAEENKNAQVYSCTLIY